MQKKNILILGAGFGGITAALAIARGIGSRAREYDIILVDRHHHQLYTPALYEIAAIPTERAPEALLRSSVLIPIAEIVYGRPIRFVRDEFIRLQPRDKVAFLKNTGPVPYCFLIVSLGSETDYFNIPGLQEHGFPLKTYDDAIRLRDALERSFRTDAPAKIVIGGAGASGVELAAECVNFFRAVRKNGAGQHPGCRAEITLVEASPDILPGFHPQIVEAAKKRLAALGVICAAGRRIQSVSKTAVAYRDGTESAYDVLIWTGGVRGSSVLARTGLALSDKNSLIVNAYLQAESPDGTIFAVGDSAAAAHPGTGGAVVWNAPAAEAEAKIAAYNILAEIRGRTKKPFAPKRRYPFVLALGRKYAAADLIYLRCAGLAGWCVKQLVELRYLCSILPYATAMRTWHRGIRAYTAND